MTWSWGLPSDWRPKLLIGVVIAIAGGGGFLVNRLPDPIDAALLGAGTAAPAFSLPDSGGQMHRLSEFRGKAVVLNFMASWCGPCQAELPLLISAAREHRMDPLAIVGIDVEETPQRVEHLVREKAIPYPLLVDANGSTAEAYKVVAYPTTYYLDPDGIVRGARTGGLAPDLQGRWYFKEALEKYLGSSIAAAKQAASACSPAPAGSPAPVLAGREPERVLTHLTCACGCLSKLLDCDCGEMRGGREMRLYLAPLLEDPDLTPWQARQIAAWKYKVEYGP